MSNPIDSILASRRAAAAAAQETTAPDPEKFFLVLKAEGITEEFIELRFRNGATLCLNYKDLQFFNHNPKEGIIDLVFGGWAAAIKGRGLAPELFEAIKSKRVAWIAEAKTEMQDRQELGCFIESILVSFPRGFGEPASEEEAE